MIGELIGGAAGLAGGLAGAFGNSAPSPPSLESEMARVFKLLYGGKNVTKKLNKGTMYEGDQPGALDDLLKMQTELAPQFEQAKLAGLQQTAPQVAQLQYDLFKQFMPQYSATQAEAARDVDPLFYRRQQELGNEFANRQGQGLSPEQTDYFAERVRSGQAVRGLADSPLGSTQEARYLTELDMAQQQQNLQNYQNFMNTYRIPQVGVMNPGMPQLGQYENWQSPSFEEMFGTSVSNRGAGFQSDMAQYDQQQGMFGTLAGMGGNLLGAGIGGIGGGNSGGGSGFGGFGTGANPGLGFGVGL